MTSGKNAPGLKGFPTPNDVPGTNGYIVFRFPDTNEWAGLLLGAASALTSEYNFYQWGDLLPEEASEIWRIIVQQAPYDTCGCEIPGNVPVFRLNGDLEFEELTDGEWLPPSGVWEIPPPDPRTEPTDDEKKCLAAANAANVLKTMYESITDSYAETLAQDAAMNALAAAVAGVLLVPVMGEIMLALYTLSTVAMGVMYAAQAFLTEDLWGEDFDEELVCLMLDSASVDGSGVVHFDASKLVNDVVNALVFDVDLTLGQQRLALQVGYMIQMIGSQGLDIAGGTTAISSFDCACGVRCIIWDFRTGLHGATLLFGTQVGGVGIQGDNGGFGSDSDATVMVDFPEVLVHQVNVQYTKTTGSGSNNTNRTLLRLMPTFIEEDFTNTLGTELVKSILPEANGDNVYQDLNSGTGGGTVVIHQIVMYYSGDEITGQGEPC